MQVDPVAAVIAAVAVGIAVWSNVIARSAARSSRDSAAEAKRSSDEAVAANGLTREEVARTKEVVDVDWAIEQSAEGLVRCRNVGTTTAHSVAALVRVNGERFDVVAGDVPSGEAFECDAAHVFQAKRDANRRAVQSMQSSGINFFPSSSVSIEARITWQSAMGTPGVRLVTNSKKK